jgi:hypothetical protein
VAICNMKIRGKDERCREEGIMPNGRCPKHWRRTEANRNTASRRHQKKKAAGEPARFYDLTPEIRQAQAYWTGKRRSDENKAAIGKGVAAAHLERQIKDAIASAAKYGHDIIKVCEEVNATAS